jgi:uncharacterized repeat protein (TIGR01451 family)
MALMKKTAIQYFVTGIALLLSVPATAQERPVSLASSMKLVVPADPASQSAERLVDATNVVPSDQLEFSVSYRNGGGAPVSDLLIVNPVPASVQVTQQAAEQAEVSIDGGAHWGALGDLVVTQANGSTAPATVDDISHLRWKIALIDPGQSGTVSFRARVR